MNSIVMVQTLTIFEQKNKIIIGEGAATISNNSPPKK